MGNETIYFPAQCSCGHMIFERYVVRVSENTIRPFTWCGFCRTRVNMADRPGEMTGTIADCSIGPI